MGCVRKSVDVTLKLGAAADGKSSRLQCTAPELRGPLPPKQVLQPYHAPTTTAANRLGGPPTNPDGTHTYPHHSTVVRTGLASTASAAGLATAPRASVCKGTWPTPAHISTGTWPSLCPHLHRDWARPCPHLHRDWAHRWRIRTATARSGDPRRAVLLDEVDDGVPVFFVRQRRDDEARVRREQHLPLLRNRAARDPSKRRRSPGGSCCWTPPTHTCGKNEYALMSRPELIAILKITPAARSVKPFAAAKSVVALVNAPHCTGRPSLYSRSTMPLSGNL